MHELLVSRPPDNFSFSVKSKQNAKKGIVGFLVTSSIPKLKNNFLPEVLVSSDIRPLGT